MLDPSVAGKICDVIIALAKAQSTLRKKWLRAFTSKILNTSFTPGSSEGSPWESMQV